MLLKTNAKMDWEDQKCLDQTPATYDCAQCINSLPPPGEKLGPCDDDATSSNDSLIPKSNRVSDVSNEQIRFSSYLSDSRRSFSWNLPAADNTKPIPPGLEWQNYLDCSQDICPSIDANSPHVTKIENMHVCKHEKDETLPLLRSCSPLSFTSHDNQDAWAYSTREIDCFQRNMRSRIISQKASSEHEIKGTEISKRRASELLDDTMDWGSDIEFERKESVTLNSDLYSDTAMIDFVNF